MCGICGILALRGQRVDENALQQMVTTLYHRGPDHAGHVVVGPCGLGTTRLAVIDLSEAANQPLHVFHKPTETWQSQTTDAWISYNGEVYNYQEVQAALRATKHRLNSNSDTETLLRSYIQFGPENFLKPFRGMFALAIWDDTRQTLLLARDRLGKKPLYYYYDAEWLVFGSEIKALLQHPAVPKQVNERVIPYFLAYGYPPTPETMFDNIFMLPPGHMLSLDLRADDPLEQMRIYAYWEPPYPATGPDPRSEENIASDLLAHLRWAVRLRMISDVPLGAFLSGGLDSAAIVALMAQESHQAVKTFSIGFKDEATYDETGHARRVATRYVTEHHEFIVDPNTIDLVNELVWYHDQPFGDSSAIPTYLVSKMAREFVTVALTGDGGDELFAGYDRFRAARLARTYAQLPSVAQRVIDEALDWLPESGAYYGFVRRANRFVHAASLPLSERYLSWVRYVPSVWLAALVGDDKEQAIQDHYESLFARQPTDEGDITGQLLDINLRTYLPDDLLVKLDRCSMATSLETRSPFLDHRLLEFVAGIPSDLKLKGGTSKYILKRALRGVLPDKVIDRQKHGFGVPVGVWFRTDLAEYTQSILLGDRAHRRGYFDMDAVRGILTAHASGKVDLGYTIWMLLTFELWLRRFFDPPDWV
jgi:asparagine synthase (glutamine-hydrolysing)